MITGAGAVTAAIITAIVTILPAHSPNTTNSTVSISNQPQVTCPVLGQEYYSELHRNPGILKAFMEIASADPVARECGITANVLELMLKN
jgi:hypothetical protein